MPFSSIHLSVLQPELRALLLDQGLSRCCCWNRCCLSRESFFFSPHFLLMAVFLFLASQHTVAQFVVLIAIIWLLQATPLEPSVTTTVSCHHICTHIAVFGYLVTLWWRSFEWLFPGFLRPLASEPTWHGTVLSWHGTTQRKTVVVKYYFSKTMYMWTQNKVKIKFYRKAWDWIYQDLGNCLLWKLRFLSLMMGVGNLFFCQGLFGYLKHQLQGIQDYRLKINLLYRLSEFWVLTAVALARPLQIT